MGETARWGGHIFEVSSKKIQGIKGLSIKGSSETENETSSSQDYVTRKKGSPTEISFTAVLNAYTGCDVEKEVTDFIEDAKNGTKDYLYIFGKKLFTYQIMLTNAHADQVELSPSGNWVKAEVQLTFKQTQEGSSGSSGFSGSSGSSGSSGISTGSYSTSGSNKISVKSSNTVSEKTTANVVKTAVNVSTGIVQASTLVHQTASVINAVKYGTSVDKTSVVKTAVSTVGNLIQSAKNYSSIKKTVTSTINKLIKR